MAFRDAYRIAAIEAAAAEAQTGFAILKTIEHASAQAAFSVLGQLTGGDRVAAAKALSYSFHLKDLKDPDEEMRQRAAEIRLQIRRALAMHMLPPGKRPSRKRLQEELMPLLGPIFDREGSEWRHELKANGMSILSTVDAGGSGDVLRISHTVIADGVPVGALLSFLELLGVSSSTAWQRLEDFSSVRSAIKAVFEVIQRANVGSHPSIDDI
jgi:hypothetical protein